MHTLISELEKSALRTDVPDFRPGDTLEVHVRVIEGDIFQTDFSRANVVFFFLLPSVNDRLLPLFRRQLKPGTRLLSREFQFREWPAEQTLSLPGFTFYAWTLPPRAVAADHP